jgi:hypothetical protein
MTPSEIVPGKQYAIRVVVNPKTFLRRRPALKLCKVVTATTECKNRRFAYEYKEKVAIHPDDGATSFIHRAYTWGVRTVTGSATVSQVLYEVEA